MGGIMAQTPMKCFRILGMEIYTEDMTGYVELVCTARDQDMLDWLMSSLVSFHTSVPTLTWNKPVKALTPFNVKQIEALEIYQASGVHPYTCGRQSLHGLLIPKRHGWICNELECNYRQDWAHAEHTGVS